MATWDSTEKFFGKIPGIAFLSGGIHQISGRAEKADRAYQQAWEVIQVFLYYKKPVFTLCSATAELPPSLNQV